MIIRPWAEFASDLPEDHIENEEGTEILQFGGKSVAGAIGEMLERLGCTVSPPIYAHEHGWELDATLGKRRFWGQVTLIENYIFIFEDRTFAAKLLGGRHPIYRDLLTRLAGELARDTRFHNVSWYTSGDLLTGTPGAKNPVS